MVPNFGAELGAGHLLSLADTRYVLVEPPHHIAPPRIEEFFFGLLVAGYVPILTHPERLTWLAAQYETVQRLVRGGVWMQITAGSLAGAFGRTAQYWAERMLDETCVHLLATDAHDVERRPPNLGLGYECAAKRVGDIEARNLVLTRPEGVLRNELPANLPPPNSAVASSGIVYIEPGVDTDRRDVAGTGHSPTDRDAAGRGFAGRLRRLFR